MPGQQIIAGRWKPHLKSDLDTSQRKMIFWFLQIFMYIFFTFYAFFIFFFGFLFFFCVTFYFL